MGFIKCFKWFLILCPLLSIGQTRFYTTGSVTTVVPTLHTAWNVTTGNAVSLMLSYRTRANVIGTISSGASGAVSPRQMIWRQFVSLPLMPQTLNCTVTGQIKMNESMSGSVTGGGIIYLRLINENGTVSSELGNSSTLVNGNLTSALTNRTFPDITLSGVSVTTGQRMEIDIGFTYTVGTQTANLASAVFTDNGSTGNLPVDNVSTASLNNWFEFSQTLKFQRSAYFFF